MNIDDIKTVDLIPLGKALKRKDYVEANSIIKKNIKRWQKETDTESHSHKKTTK